MEKLKEHKAIFIISILFLINIFIFNSKMINIHTDFGREVLFSKMVSQGAVLYKDIFNTFVCPFSYLFNGMILKFAPINLNTFYTLGALNCAVISGGIYFISRKFCGTFISAVLGIFVMYYCCFYAGLMNFLTPYSYAIVYGLCACIISIIAYLEFLKSDKKVFLYATFLFGGLSASCKYEFCLYGLLLFIFFFIKKCNIKDILYSLGAFLFFPVLCTAVLFLQGLAIQDISNYLELLKNFLHQPYLKKVYAITCYLNKDSLVSSIKTFAVAGILFFTVFKLYRNDSAGFKTARFMLWSVLIVGVFFFFHVAEYFSYAFFGFVTYAILLLSLFKIKELFNDKAVLFLVSASLVISVKSFWFLSANFYGRYFLPLLVISLFVVLKEFYFNEENPQKTFEKTFCAILIFLSFAAFRINAIAIVLKDRVLKTPYGNINLTKEEETVFKPLVEYIAENTNKKQTLVVLGQAPLLNFLTDRDSFPFYSHYDEAIAGAYGDKRIIEAYKTGCPDYIVVFDGQAEGSYCKSYGKQVCGWVFKNYNKEKEIGKSERVFVMRKK